MRIFRNGKLLGKEVQVGEWGTSKVKGEEDGRITLSNETEGEAWSVMFDSGEVEMIVSEAGTMNENAVRKLTQEVDRLLDQIRNEEAGMHQAPGQAMSSDDGLTRQEFGGSR